MSAILVLVNIFLALIAIVLIVAVLMQEGNREGLGAISGGAETFLGKNKAKSVEGKLELITKWGATAFIILAIVSTILTARINKNSSASTTTTTPTTVEDTTVSTDTDDTVVIDGTNDASEEDTSDEASDDEASADTESNG